MQKYVNGSEHACFFLFRNVHYERNCVKSCTLECAVAKKRQWCRAPIFFLFGCYRLILLSRKRVVVFFVLIIDIL